jgi:lipopolysaccharide export system permease protein
MLGTERGMMLRSRLITQVDRYLFRQLTLALFAVTGALTAFVWLVQSLRFVGLVVQHGLSIVAFVRLTGLLIPSFVAVILPITTFVVTQFVYQRLAGDRELTVMHAAGLSPLTVARPAVAVAALAMVACYALNLWLVPSTLKSFRKLQWEIRNQAAALLLQEGVFTQVSDGVTVYIRSRGSDGSLHGILVDDTRDSREHVTILAETGHFSSDGNPIVELENGSRQEIDRQTGRLNIMTFRQNTFDLSSLESSKEAVLPDISDVSLHQLYHPPPFIKGADATRWIAEAHKRLSTPITALSYALIALLAVLTGPFRRHGNFLRPLISVFAIVGLLAIGLVVQSLAARNNALLPLVWLQAIAPGLICSYFLLVDRRSTWPRQPFKRRRKERFPEAEPI